MHHDRAMLAGRLLPTYPSSKLRESEIELDGRELPETANGVDEFFMSIFGP